MFVVNPDKYLLPNYLLSPFQTGDVARNHLLTDSTEIDSYFNSRFGLEQYTYTSNGRHAINLALSDLELNRDNEVAIMTTSGNRYISSCVTSEIENFCSWTCNTITPKTKVIFVIHEFGFPYKSLLKLAELDLTIIEDCAYSFFTDHKESNMGSIGDYCIFSFPKMFPIQTGGLLYKRRSPITSHFYCQNEKPLQYIKNILSNQLESFEIIKSKRLENYENISKYFKHFSLEPRFELQDKVIPGAFIFKGFDDDVNLDKLKTHFYANGIQCSVFYGERSFYIPCHQALTEPDILYFSNVMDVFLTQKS